MRVLFVDQFSELGGAQLALLDILDEVIRRGWEAEVMVPGDGPLLRLCADRSILTRVLPLAPYANGHKTASDVLRYGLDSVRATLAVCEAARLRCPDLIYVNGPRALPAATFAARWLRCPLIFHLHSCLDRRYTRLIAECCERLTQLNVIAISHFVARPFVHARKATLRIIYNGVADHGFRERGGSPPTVIGIVGRICPEKGHIDFVEAAKILAERQPALRYVVFGAAWPEEGTYEGEVREAAKGLPVEFRGWTENVSASLQDIDILTVPSGPAEGATRVIMEAFSAGVPVVAYPSGGIPELVRHGETGCLTSERNPESLAEAIQRFIDEPLLMRRLSIQGRNEWETKFQVERCQREICDFMAETGRPSAFLQADNLQRKALRTTGANTLK